MTENEAINPGELLRKTRERLGLSVNDVSVATKINPRILKSLEEGSLEGLPARPFTRGFIRTYAMYLKLDPDPILAAFEMSEETVPVPEAPAPEATYERRRENGSDMALKSKTLVASGIFVLIVLVLGIKKIVDRYAQETIVETPVNIDALEPDPAESTEEEESAAAADAEPKDTSTEASVDKESATAPVASETPTVLQPPAQAVPAAPVAPQPTPPAAAAATTPAPAAPKPATPAAPATQAQEVIVEALDQVQLTVRIDGGSARTLDLKPESLHTIKAQKEIVIESNDGGRINVVHNGKDRGVPGDLGKPVRLKYP